MVLKYEIEIKNLTNKIADLKFNFAELSNQMVKTRDDIKNLPIFDASFYPSQSEVKENTDSQIRLCRINQMVYLYLLF